MTDSAGSEIAAGSVTADVSELIRATVEEHRAVLVGPLSSGERRDFEEFYRAGRFHPAWTDERGRPTDDAKAGLSVLRDAAAEGLEPDTYAAGVLDTLSASLAASTARSVTDIAAFDTGLSVGVLRYFRHIHVGRVDPQAIGFRTIRPDNTHDYVVALRSALERHRVPETAVELAPNLELYRKLREALSQYRAISESSQPFRLTVSGSVEPSSPFDQGESLRRHLVVLGDISADASGLDLTGSYAPVLVEGVKKFQIRHGLTADGVLGKATAAALNVPLGDRVRQIEFALERLRWLPHLGAGRFIGVNVPMFRLWAWDDLAMSRLPSLTMNVIVGKAPSTRTPVLASEIEQVVARPYWNVPASIARGELIPAWRRDHGYFDRHALELVAGAGDAAPVVPATETSVAELEQGRLRLRQRPGPTNSLGLLKFIFPNEENVYLHGTPATELFNRSRRDFSHGCVRVEDPFALADWLLQGQAGWTRDRIVEATGRSRPSAIRLEKPVQVILFYITAAVFPEDGAIHFADDIYGHDQILDRALRAD